MVDTTGWKENEFETVDDAENEIADLRQEVEKLKARLSEHDGCSRWGVKDAILLKS